MIYSYDFPQFSTFFEQEIALASIIQQKSVAISSENAPAQGIAAGMLPTQLSAKQQILCPYEIYVAL